jgi:hypothetical protein
MSMLQGIYLQWKTNNVIHMYDIEILRRLFLSIHDDPQSGVMIINDTEIQKKWQNFHLKLRLYQTSSECPRCLTDFFN